MEGNHKVTHELSRELSLFQLTMMGLGMMIGAGVFIGIGNSIGKAGPGGTILTFALNTVLAMCTAMSYAELSSAIPKAGGAYNFARIGFGRGTSFVAGWMEWFASSVAGSMYAITFAIYTVRYLDQLGWLEWLPVLFEFLRQGGLTWLPQNPLPLFERVVAIVIAISFIYINYRGVSETGMIGAIMTLGQTIFLVFIGVVGVIVAVRDPSRLANFQPFIPRGWDKLLITMGFTYVAFEGFEVISQAGDEAIEPRKNLPKAMLYSVFTVGVIYVLVSFAAIVAVKAGSPGITGAPWEWIAQFKERGFGEAVARLIPFGNFFLTLAVIFASTSALNATIFSATRASYALGRDRMLPTFFSKISRKRKTPHIALICTGIIILTVVFLKTEDVASSASIMFLFLFFLVNICVIKVRLNMGDELKYGYVMPLFPLFPIIAIIAQGILAVNLVHMSPLAWIIAPSWIAAGVIIYFLYSKSRVLPSEDEIVVLEEEKAPAGDEYRVMIPISNPSNAISLVGNTIKICSDKKARIKLLHMATVPDLLTLEDAEKYIMEGKEGIVEAMIYLISRFPITTTILHCRNIARGIVSTVRQKRVNLLIMGWHGQKTDHRFIMGSTLDQVISRSPSNIVILKDCGNKKFKDVLVPVFKSRNDSFALEIADLLTEKDGKITILPVGSQKSNINSRYITSIMKRVKNHRVEIKETRCDNRAGAVLRETKGHDLLVLGILRPEHFYSSNRLSLQEDISHSCDLPLAIVKETRGLSNFTKHWL